MSEIQTDSHATPEEVQLRDEVGSLRQQVWTLLVILVIVSGTLSIFLMRQVTYARKDLTVARELVASNQAMDQFVQRLAEYSKAHPDFAPILAKYGVTWTPTAPPQK